MQQFPTIGILYAWWRGDPIERLAPTPGLAIEPADPGDDLASIDGLNASEARALQHDGHRLYLARLDGETVARGWCATRHASIGELGVDMTLSPTERYLWDFETLPRSRGRGIYIRMLQAILQRETDASRFWIGHDVGNDASARGILRAGFAPVGEVYQRSDGALRYVVTGDAERGRAGSRLLGIPLANERDGPHPPEPVE